MDKQCQKKGSDKKKRVPKVKITSILENMTQPLLFREEDPTPNYHSLDDFPKDVKKMDYGIFSFPDIKVGKLRYGERKFVVFYFDNEEDYQKVVNKLGITIGKTREHPNMDTKKLLGLIDER